MTEDVSASEAPEIRAFKAIGRGEAQECDLDFEQHLRALKEGPDTAALLCALRDDRVRPMLSSYSGIYRERDARAERARRQYQATLLLLVLLGTFLLLAFVFFAVTPPLLATYTRWAFCIIAGGVIGIMTAAVLAATRDVEPAACAVVIAVPAIALLVWAVPFTFFNERAKLLLSIAGLLLLVLMCADMASEGVVARLVGFKSPRNAWFKFRAEAEHIRREYFAFLVRTCKVIDDDARGAAPAAAVSSEPDTAPPPLALQVLEFVRRFHFRVQQQHYSVEQDASKASLSTAKWYRFVVLAVGALLLALYGGLGEIAAQSEQEGSGAASRGIERIEAWALDLVASGGDDLLLLLSLLCIGVGAYFAVLPALNQTRRSQQRYSTTSSRLKEATGSVDAAFKNDNSQIAKARAAALERKWNPLIDMCREFNGVLSSEINDWRSDMWRIERLGSPAQPRLIADEQISPTQFDEIAQALNVEPRRFRKTGFIAVEVVREAQDVITSFYGEETRNRAEPGDWIVVNIDNTFDRSCDPDDHFVRDNRGNCDRYVIKKPKVKDDYRPMGIYSRHGVIHEALIPDQPADVIDLKAGFDILAPWGQRQIRDSGVIIRKNGEVYGIYSLAFATTYVRA